MKRQISTTALQVAALFCLLQTAVAQVNIDHYHPLSQHTPPGETAAWLNAIRKYDPHWMQPIVVEAPSGGSVDIFSMSPVPLASGSSPAAMSANVGHLYRLRISDMPDFPGVELYPTIELIDRLHPPAGREHEFPIPIILTKKDVETARQGRLVTRVVYLEQPQYAQVNDPLRRVIPQRVTPSENALKEADRLGRPMAIIRLGGRAPTASSPASFWGTGGSARAFEPENSDAAVVRMGPQRSDSRVQQTRFPRQ